MSNPGAINKPFENEAEEIEDILVSVICLHGSMGIQRAKNIVKKILDNLSQRDFSIVRVNRER